LLKTIDWTTIHLTNVRETGEKINMSLNLEQNKDLRTRTTMKTGGKAEFFAQPVRVTDLQELLRWASDEGHQMTVIGGGSNILISDAGIRGLVIDMRMFKHMTVRGCLLTASAGNLLEKAVSSASEAGLSGLEVFSGLPGTIGGAVTGNAGCFGHEISEPLAWVEYMDLDGNIHRDAKEDLSFAYRESPFKHNHMISLEAAFLLEPAEPHIVTGRAKQYRQRRREMGQYRNPSMGSVFKNPLSPDGRQQLSAGKLIEEAGLLGFTHHKAQVADYHGNYIINPTGEATSQDIYDLVRIIQQRITEQNHIELEPEIRFLGEFAQHSAP
jgi:UDP-N-acetylmuramate dehydrogenase